MNIHAWRILIADDENLSFNAKGIGMMLCMFYRPGNECFPSQDTLQSKCNLGSENTLKKGLKELEQFGYIRRTKKHLAGKRHFSIVYEFIIPGEQVSNFDTTPVSLDDTRTSERVSNNDTRKSEQVSNFDTVRVSERVSNLVSKFDTEYREHREIDVVENARAEKQQQQTIKKSKLDYKFFVPGRSDAECRAALLRARKLPTQKIIEMANGESGTYDPISGKLFHYFDEEMDIAVGYRVLLERIDAKKKAGKDGDNTNPQGENVQGHKQPVSMENRGNTDNRRE